MKESKYKYFSYSILLQHKMKIISVNFYTLIFISFLFACTNEEGFRFRNNIKYLDNPHVKYLEGKKGIIQILQRTEIYTVSEALDLLNDGNEFYLLSAKRYLC